MGLTKIFTNFDVLIKQVMETKTEQAIKLFREGEERKALKIFATFRLGFTEEERRTIKIASEVSNIRFYQSLGIDTDREMEKAKELLKNRYDI